MKEPKIPTARQDRDALPTMENISNRLRDGATLTGMAVVLAEGDDAYVDLTLSLKVGKSDNALGTLVCPLCDYPLLIALLTVSTTLLRVNFHYECDEASRDWKKGMPDAQKQ